MKVVVEKFIVKRPVKYTVPKRWASYTYARIFIDGEYKGEWFVMEHGSFKAFLEKAKKKYNFENYELRKGSSENRDF